MDNLLNYIGMIGYILGLYWENGKENKNYYNESCRDYVVYIRVYVYVFPQPLKGSPFAEPGNSSARHSSTPRAAER